jgi:hypothetical protein
MGRITLLTFALAAFAMPVLADTPKRKIELNSERIGVLGLPLLETDKPVHRVVLNAEVGEKGEGKGVLILDLTGPPVYDEFGFAKGIAPTSEIKLDCELKLVKSTTQVYTVRVGGPGSDKYEEVRQDWKLFSITGPKIKSKLFLTLPSDLEWPRGRFLVHGADGKVKHLVDLVLPPQPEPCHPGCFPAGTIVQIPGGTASVEKIQVGDSVTTVNAAGRTSTARVEAVSVTRNRLVEVKTSNGTVLTTETQPLALEKGDYRAAGELKPGDRVWRWSDNKRQAVDIVSVKVVPRQVQVYNLVLGVPTTFIAGDFLARSKPPVGTVEP